MSRRRILGSVGALAMVALLMAPVPAQALGARARGEAHPPLAFAWKALADLWQGALELVGLRPVIEAEGGASDPNG